MACSWSALYYSPHPYSVVPNYATLSVMELVSAILADLGAAALDSKDSTEKDASNPLRVRFWAEACHPYLPTSCAGYKITLMWSFLSCLQKRFKSLFSTLTVKRR